MHKNFFMVPNRIFKQELRPRDFMVYCCLLSHCDKNMTCFPSRQLISRECRIDKKTVDAAIKNLIDNNLISKGPRTRWNGANSSNMYFVNNYFFRVKDIVISFTIKSATTSANKTNVVILNVVAVATKPKMS